MNKAEMLQKRAALWAQAEEIRNKSELTAEDRQKFDAIMVDFDAVSEDIKREERAEEITKQVAATAYRKAGAKEEVRAGRVTDTAEYRDAFWKYLREDRNALFPEQYQILNSREARALSLTDANGGYTVPDEFNRTLVQALENQNVMRRLAKVITSSSGSMEIPVVSAHGAAAWTAEGGAFNESDETFDHVTLGANKATRIIKVSEELLNDSAFDLESYLASEFARSIGALEETAFVVGTGSGQPTGVMDSATAGLTTASATAITADEVITLYHKLRRPYRRNAYWLMNDTTALAVRLLKDTNDQYLWVPGLGAGEADRLLGKPVEYSDAVPEIAATKRVIAFGDFSYYWIADRGNRSFQRLNELYSANGQVGFRGYERVDGKLTLAEAVVAMVMKAV